LLDADGEGVVVRREMIDKGWDAVVVLETDVVTLEVPAADGE
jgi:hypothetical protein